MDLELVIRSSHADMFHPDLFFSIRITDKNSIPESLKTYILENPENFIKNAATMYLPFPYPLEIVIKELLKKVFITTEQQHLLAKIPEFTDIVVTFNQCQYFKQRDNQSLPDTIRAHITANAAITIYECGLVKKFDWVYSDPKYDDFQEKIKLIDAFFNTKYENKDDLYDNVVEYLSDRGKSELNNFLSRVIPDDKSLQLAMCAEALFRIIKSTPIDKSKLLKLQDIYVGSMNKAISSEQSNISDLRDPKQGIFTIEDHAVPGGRYLFFNAETPRQRIDNHASSLWKKILPAC